MREIYNLKTKLGIDAEYGYALENYVSPTSPFLESAEVLYVSAAEEILATQILRAFFFSFFFM